MEEDGIESAMLWERAAGIGLNIMKENSEKAMKKTTGIKQLCLCLIKPEPVNSF
jgi:hypothetical protein